MLMLTPPRSQIDLQLQTADDRAYQPGIPAIVRNLLSADRGYINHNTGNVITLQPPHGADAQTGFTHLPRVQHITKLTRF